MAQTDIHGWPLPEPTATANVPQDMKNLADQIDRQTPHVCTSSTRPSPIAGLIIYETNTKRTYMGTGTDWYILGQEWVAFTPNWKGWASLGSSPISRGAYCVGPGGVVTVNVRLRSGAGASMGHAPLVVDGFPVKSAGGIQQFGVCSFLHTGPQGLLRDGMLAMGNGADGASIFIPKHEAPVVHPGNAGIPWGSGSEIHGTITYPSTLGKAIAL